MGQQRVRGLDGIIDSLDMNLNKLPEILKDGEWHAAVHEGHKEPQLVTEQQTFELI